MSTPDGFIGHTFLRALPLAAVQPRGGLTLRQLNPSRRRYISTVQTSRIQGMRAGDIYTVGMESRGRHFRSVELLQGK